MSIHRSLKKRAIKSKSVLKRYERLRKLIDKDKWQEGMSVFGLPKINPPKLKLSKPKDEKATTSLGKTDILEEHKLAKEKAEKGKKQRKQTKETTGRK